LTAIVVVGAFGYVYIWWKVIFCIFEITLFGIYLSRIDVISLSSLPLLESFWSLFLSSLLSIETSSLSLPLAQGWRLSDMMFVTRRGLSDACSSVAKQLDTISSSVSVIF